MPYGYGLVYLARIFLSTFTSNGCSVNASAGLPRSSSTCHQTHLHLLHVGSDAGHGKDQVALFCVKGLRLVEVLLDDLEVDPQLLQRAHNRPAQAIQVLLRIAAVSPAAYSAAGWLPPNM